MQSNQQHSDHSQSGQQSTPTPSHYDLVIIGGGINGTGIARDAAGRGLKVLLCDQGDLGCATSSASSKLIHGGLRYLEHYAFRLVREALQEREVLLANAPHLVKPMRFRLPHAPHLRPAWMIRAGLFLYDCLARRKTLPGCRALKLHDHSPLQPAFTKAFEYSDCWTDDARLVIANALSAHELGATILPRTRCQSASRGTDGWNIQLSDRSVRSTALINATGPWVARFIEDQLQQQPEYGIRMIKGSHIVVPALHDGDEAYILQNADKRIVFVIPWMGKWSMIGTTDVEHTGDPAAAAPSEQEIDYLLSICNSHFRQQLCRDDIVHQFSGVRPLCDDESSELSAITRDYTLTVSDSSEKYPLLNIFGGKLTTYRKLAESALEKLQHWFPGLPPAWTHDALLPGGHIPSQQGFIDQLQSQKPWLPHQLARRYATSYGDLSFQFLNDCSSLEQMGEHFGNGLYQAEVDYLLRREWARSAEDILWRRTKTGVGLPEADRQRLSNYLQDRGQSTLQR